MDKQITLGLMLIAVAAMGTMGLITASANADKTLTCDTSKDCNVIIRKLKVGDDLIIQFKASPPSGGSGNGGGGTVPAATVDQEARDDISGLKSADVAQDNELSRLTTENTALKGNLTAVASQVTAQANDIETLKAQIANISAVNPIVDINVTHPGQNETTPEPEPVPPVDNGTVIPTPPVDNGTVITPPGNETGVGNETTPIPPVDNGTVVVPPIDNGTVIPPVDNGTIVTPPDNGTVIVEPPVPGSNETTVTPPDNGTVIVTPPGSNETGTGNDTGFFPAPNSSEPVVNPLQ